MKFPLSPDHIVSHIIRVGQEFIYGFENTFDKDTKERLIEMHRIVDNIVHTKDSFCFVSIAITVNQQIIYELM